MSPPKARCTALTIDADFELVRLFETAHGTEVRAKESDLKLILAIDGGVRSIANRRPCRAAAVDVARLRRIPNTIDLARRRRLRIADGERGNAIRSREITLQQHRRHAEDVGNVVEPRARISTPPRSSAFS